MKYAVVRCANGTWTQAYLALRIRYRTPFGPCYDLRRIAPLPLRFSGWVRERIERAA